jgi:hypothetical protein
MRKIIAILVGTFLTVSLTACETASPPKQTIPIEIEIAPITPTAPTEKDDVEIPEMEFEEAPTVSTPTLPPMNGELFDIQSYGYLTIGDTSSVTLTLKHVEDGSVTIINTSDEVIPTWIGDYREKIYLEIELVDMEVQQWQMVDKVTGEKFTNCSTYNLSQRYPDVNILASQYYFFEPEYDFENYE